VAGLAQAGNAHRLVRLAEGARGWAKANGRNLVVGYDPEVVRELTGEERAERARREQGLAALGALARAVDAKDQSTREHSERVAALAESLSLLLGWSVRRASDLRDAALMHDVGKIGVPDAILFKQESLTDAEFTAIKGHASLGGEITSEVLSEEQVSWIRSHHERWDGRGYPDGLGGVQIPDGARIICVADAFDVMVNIRTYKEPVAPDAALDECVRCAATQFSPDVVGALRTLLEVSGPSGGPPQRSR
jgi:putative nucleotidyltransferase with HDIG domain